ncbi:hypothetical protein FPC831_360004 [Flavobacterium psychrophilum]|nr:hypothetical protein FPC831_360004 [Flavobacterium psychrophilum]
MQATHKIFKRKKKKEKKESRPSSGGFKKNKFFRKNTTLYFIGNEGVKSEWNVVPERYGWRFFLKPVGLELFFLETGTYLYFLLFIFLFFF